MGLLDWIEGIGGAIAAPFTGGATIPLAVKGFGSGIADAAGGGQNPGANLAGAAGAGISAATDAAAKNRLEQEKLGIGAVGENTAGQSAFETELLNRAKLEELQKQEALKDIYRSSAATNPRVSPFDPAGGPKLSPQYMTAAQTLANEGAQTIAAPSQYTTSKMPALAPYTPLDIKNLPKSTGTEESTLAKVGDVAGPSLSTLSMIMRLLGNKAPAAPGTTPVNSDMPLTGIDQSLMDQFMSGNSDYSTE